MRARAPDPSDPSPIHPWDNLPPRSGTHIHVRGDIILADSLRAIVTTTSTISIKGARRMQVARDRMDDSTGVGAQRAHPNDGSMVLILHVDGQREVAV